MEGCLDSEMADLQGFQCESPEAIGQDDEDEVEELRNSLREAVKDQTVKPKLHCLMVDQSFSMVTVQSEDSGIVWETASSRCSTPWASETSSISEAYSMEGSGTQGNITIVFDEEQIVRRRTRSGGRSSRLSDRLRRPRSSRSGSALGVERPEMAEVSVPNVKQEEPKGGPDLEEIKDKDQQLFSLISEGYEILNIRVPSKLPTVDEEESTELQDNLSYLEQTPRIRSKKIQDVSQPPPPDIHLSGEVDTVEHKEDANQDPNQPLADPEIRDMELDSTGDMDYFEKFTLVDAVVPGRQARGPQQEVKAPAETLQTETTMPGQITATVSLSATDESFVFVTDEVEIAGNHLDEVFYGNGVQETSEFVLEQREEAARESREKLRVRRASSLKDSGSVLFGSEETVLTPIYLPPGPPKIIDPILLEEPTAMSFMYSDLYEDAVGERMKSEEHSEAESVASERTFNRRLSDSEEADGYLEMFILKDETPTVEVRPQNTVVKGEREGRMMWPQNIFDMTGCLTKVEVQEVKEVQVKNEETRRDEESAVERDLPSTKEKEEEEVWRDEESTVERDLTSSKEEEEGWRDEESTVERDLLSTEGKEEEDARNEEETAVEEDLQSTKNKEKEEARRAEESAVEEDLKSSTDKEKEQPILVTPKQVDEKQPSVAVPFGKPPEESVHTPKGNEIKETPEQEVKKAQSKEQHKEKPEKVLREPGTETRVLSQQHKAIHVNEVVSEAKEETFIKIMPEIVITPEPKSDNIDINKVPAKAQDETQRVIKEMKKSVIEEEALGPKPIAAVQEVGKVSEITATKYEVTGEVEAPATVTQETVNCIVTSNLVEMEKFNEGPLGRERDAVVAEMAEPVLDGTEIQAQDQNTILQANSNDTTGQMVVLYDEKGKEPIKEVIVAGLTKCITEVVAVNQRSEVKMDISKKVMQPVVIEEAKTRLDGTLTGVSGPNQSQAEEAVNIKELDKRKLPYEADKSKTSSDVQEDVDVGGELLFLVPKGKAVEMDIEIGQLSEMVKKSKTIPPPEAESTCDDLEACEKNTICPARPQPQSDYILTNAEPERKPEQVSNEKVLPTMVSDRQAHSPSLVGVAGTEVKEQKADEDLETEHGLCSPLRSFTPLEDLSKLQREELGSATEMHTDDVEPETDRARNVSEMQKDYADQQLQQNIENTYLQAELHGDIVEFIDLTAEDLEYEIIMKQEARKIPEPQEKAGTEEPQLEFDDQERMEVDIRMEDRELDLPSGEEPIEADYDVIDAEEEMEARAAEELQGMDWFCLACGCLLSEEDHASGGHQDHSLSTVDRAYEDIQEMLSKWISELQERSENNEDLVSELELAYNSVEDQCAEIEEDMRTQNEEMMALVMDQYNSMSLSTEEEKKAKLEQLYDQIVSFQGNIDTAKGILDTTGREADTEARPPEDIETRLKAALRSTMSLELGPKGLLVFEDYAKGNHSHSHRAQRKGIPVPLKPTLQPQEPGSATSASVMAYWTVNPGDIIDCFQVYCMEDPRGVSEEYRVTVKESYCVLEELKPNKTYRVWVMAVNYSGCSLPSERLAFRTAPPVPVVDSESCSVMWGSATLRWGADTQCPGRSYTLEYCRQYDLEGEGLRSISGIRGTEQKVLLQPNENYLFYIKAVNEAGSSEQSEAALISTKTTRFHLLKASAHPLLELSVDQTTIHYHQSTRDDTRPVEQQCPTILGELLPVRGRYYWETIVTGCAAYRVGVAYPTVNQNRLLGENSKSWCLQCTPAASSCRYRLLHDAIQSDMIVTETPERVGILLDYQKGRLSFYNARSGQLLASLSHRFTQPCHPTLGLEMPGSLVVSMVLEMPEFTRHR